jgi:LuxR family maltose regulon positive regulatory protein
MNIATEPGLEQLRILLSCTGPERAHLLFDVARRIEAQGLRPDDDIRFGSATGYRREPEYADLARALIALDRAAEALPLLERLLHAAQSMGRWGDVIRYLLQQAVAFYALGDTSSALGSLAQALPLAEPEGYVRIFVDEGPPMAELLRAFHRAQPAISPSYVAKLLAAFGSADDDATPTVRRPSSVVRRLPLIEPLSTRELEVLHLIAAGHKYAQIAEQLVISMNTVRHHTRNIYGKLDVHSRSQAVARARELGLL